MIDTIAQANICNRQDSLSYNIGERNPWNNYEDDGMGIQNQLLFFVILAGAICFILLGVLDAINNKTNK